MTKIDKENYEELLVRYKIVKSNMGIAWYNILNAVNNFLKMNKQNLNVPEPSQRQPPTRNKEEIR